jgi:epoxyqueuosine reductase QueG
MSANNTLLHTIKQQLDNFVLNSPENFVADLGMMAIYDQPLLAVASAEDELWDKLKEPDVVGPQHLSPAEWLPGARSLLSCFLPFTERIRSANRSEGWPATEWLYGRYEGGFFNDTARSFMVKMVQQAGGHALNPALDERFAVVERRSNWSERHVAFIAGLGTFSLNRSLITELGSAGRFASVVTDLALEPTQRLYTETDEYCTKCGSCIRRCPPLAIDKNGKDNAICSVYVKETKARFAPRYGCGKCQTGVPCEAQKPRLPEPNHSC